MRCLVHSLYFPFEIFPYKDISKGIFALLVILHLCFILSASGNTVVSGTKLQGQYDKDLIGEEKVHSQYYIETRQPDVSKEEKKQKTFLSIFCCVLLLTVIIAAFAFRRQRILLCKRKVELDRSLLHEKHMVLDLESTNKKLTTCTLSLVHKNDLLKAVLTQVNHVCQNSEDGLGKEFYSLKHLLEHHLNHEKDWHDFNLYFEKVHSGFFRALKHKHPCLTSNDLRICALLKLNMNIKEMAALLAISPDSAKMARYRLRQKLNLSTEEDLPGYIISMDHDNYLQ